MTDVGTVWTVGVPATAARYFAPNTRPLTTAPTVRAVALHCATSPSNWVMASAAMVGADLGGGLSPHEAAS